MFVGTRQGSQRSTRRMELSTSAAYSGFELVMWMVSAVDTSLGGSAIKRIALCCAKCFGRGISRGSDISVDTPDSERNNYNDGLPRCRQCNLLASLGRCLSGKDVGALSVHAIRLFRKAGTLASLRDTFLPKLILGEIHAGGNQSCEGSTAKAHRFVNLKGLL